MIRDRVYGIETEYGYMVRQKDGVFLAPDDIHVGFLTRNLRTAGINGRGILAGGDDPRLWHLNGSLTYVDSGPHPEHATPEARSIRDAVMYYHAGDRLILDIFSDYSDHRGSMPVELFKNNVSDSKMGGFVVYGCHENYLLHRYTHKHAGGDPQILSLTPFLLTRQIIDGAGYYDKTGAFFLSQRAFFLGTMRTGNPFPLIVKDRETGIPRLHITNGDSNILECAAYLKLGTLSLMLALMEADALPLYTCIDPTRCLFDVARLGARDPVVCVQSENYISAFELQVRYCEAASRFLASAEFESEETEAELKHILKLWEQCLNAIGRNDIQWMLGRLDWATKRWLGTRNSAKGVSEETIQRRCCDLNIIYHGLGRGSLQQQMNARFPDRRIVTDEEIVCAMSLPSSETRASGRGNFIRAVQSAKRHRIRYVSIDWAHVGIETPFKFDLPMPLPLHPYNTEVQQFIGHHFGSRK